MSVVVQRLSEYRSVLHADPLRPGLILPLKASPNQRYFTDQNNVPILLTGDAPMSIVTNLAASNHLTYLQHRQLYGFNALWVNILNTTYTGGPSSGLSFDSIAPFTSGTDPSNYDLSVPNETYFARYDTFLKLAAGFGFIVFLDPIETGGWLTTLQNNGATKAFNYGVYVGNRYKGYSNLVWLHGNDFLSWATAGDNNVVAQVMAGIYSVDHGKLQSLELGTANYAVNSDVFTNQTVGTTVTPWLTANLAYTFSATPNVTLAAYQSTPVMPCFLGEGNYEFENILGYAAGATNTWRCRAEMWGAVTYGAIGGVFYGNSFIWPSTWNVDVPNRLDAPGAKQMQYVGQLLRQFSWWNLAPDSSHAVITSGFGSVPADDTDPIVATYATTSSTADGALSITYTPQSATLTADLSKFRGSITARWYDPSIGVFSAIGVFSNSGTHNFTTPGNNNDGNPDWVLVLTA